jgi:hypothetical protein
VIDLDEQTVAQLPFVALDIVEVHAGQGAVPLKTASLGN